MSEQDAADADETSDAETDAADEQSTEEETVGDAQSPPADLVHRVAEGDPEDVATEIASLRSRVEDLEGDLDERDEQIEELESKLKRKQADFQNYKKRMQKRREEEKQRAAEDLVTEMLDVRDNLVRALEQDEDTNIRGGVETTLSAFDDVLEGENVDVVDPEPGEEVDPHRHEVLVRVESDQPDGTIADVHRPGYEMAGKVIREAQVTVSEGGE